MYDLNFLAMPPSSQCHKKSEILVQCKWGVVLFLHETSSLYLSALTSMISSVLFCFFFLSRTWHHVWKKTLTMPDKYGCLETFSLWMFCFLSCFYICLSVNDLLPVYAPSWSSESFFFFFSTYLTSKLPSCLCSWSLASRPVSLGVNGVNSISVHQVTTKALTHMHTDALAPINPHTHCWIHTSTHKSWSELWGPHPDEYFLSATAFLFATCMVSRLSVHSLIDAVQYKWLTTEHHPCLPPML